jgi:hypothetical protein
MADFILAVLAGHTDFYWTVGGTAVGLGQNVSH